MKLFTYISGALSCIMITSARYSKYFTGWSQRLVDAGYDFIGSDLFSQPGHLLVSQKVTVEAVKKEKAPVKMPLTNNNF